MKHKKSKLKSGVKKDVALAEKKVKALLEEALIKSDKARPELDAERNRLKAIIGSLADGLIVLNEKERIIAINPSASNIFGVEKIWIEDKTPAEVSQYPRLNALFNQIAQTPACRNSCQLELSFKELDEKVFQVVVVPMTDKKGNTLGIIITIHDITREKNIERMKTEFVSLAAHQLRTPISAIKWVLRLVLDGDTGPISEEQKEILEKGYQSNERMIALINDLLDTARIEEGRFLYGFTFQSVEEIISKVLAGLEALIKQKKIEVVFEKPPVPLPKIKLDAEKMELAFQNLLDNSIKFNKEGGKVTISIRRDNMDNIEVTIADTGIGIPENQQNRLFSKFFRADNAARISTEGTGLGLFICKNIIESHGGKIRFKSRENEGTTFWIILPIK